MVHVQMLHVLEVLCRSRKAQCFSCTFLCLCIVQASTIVLLFRKTILMDIPGHAGPGHHPIRCSDDHNREFLEKLVCVCLSSAR